MRRIIGATVWIERDQDYVRPQIKRLSAARVVTPPERVSETSVRSVNIPIILLKQTFQQCASSKLPLHS